MEPVEAGGLGASSRRRRWVSAGPYLREKKAPIRPRAISAPRRMVLWVESIDYPAPSPPSALTPRRLSRGVGEGPGGEGERLTMAVGRNGNQAGSGRVPGEADAGAGAEGESPDTADIGHDFSDLSFD